MSAKFAALAVVATAAMQASGQTISLTRTVTDSLGGPITRELVILRVAGLRMSGPAT
jgi:hypothetical protein